MWALQGTIFKGPRVLNVFSLVIVPYILDRVEDV